MLARWLRWMLLAVLLWSALVVVRTSASGALPATILVTDYILRFVILLGGTVAAASYAVVVAMRVRGGGFPAIGASPWSLLRSFPGEWLALCGLYTLIQPFEHWLMGPDGKTSRAGGRPHILLVHGYFCNRGLWWALRRKLAASGYPVATLNLEPPHGSIEAFAARLEQRVAALETELGDSDRIVIIGHSMGGLVTREMLRRRGGAGRIAKVVTVGSPHAGTMIAYLGIGRCAREMRPGSAFLQRLGAATPPVPVVCLLSRADNFMAPVDSPALSGSRVITIDGVGHMAMAFSPRVHDILLGEIGKA